MSSDLGYLLILQTRVQCPLWVCGFSLEGVTGMWYGAESVRVESFREEHGLGYSEKEMFMFLVWGFGEQDSLPAF